MKSRSTLSVYAFSWYQMHATDEVRESNITEKLTICLKWGSVIDVKPGWYFNKWLQCKLKRTFYKTKVNICVDHAENLIEPSISVVVIPGFRRIPMNKSMVLKCKRRSWSAIWTVNYLRISCISCKIIEHLFTLFTIENVYALNCIFSIKQSPTPRLRWIKTTVCMRVHAQKIIL